MRMGTPSSTFASRVSFKKKTFDSKTTIQAEKADNTKDYVYLTLAVVYTVELFERPFTRFAEKYNTVTMLHRFVVSILISLPLIYMHIIFSQYSQLGAAQVKQIAPISRGLGITFLLATFLRLMQSGIYQADLLTYGLISLQSELPWDKCSPKYANICWSALDGNKNCSFDDGCITETRKLSGYIFWRYMYIKEPFLNTKTISLGIPAWNRICSLIVTWGLVVVVMINFLSSYKKLIKINYILTTVCIFSLVFVICLSASIVNGFQLLFKIEVVTLLNFKSWSLAIADVVEQCALGRAILIVTACDLSYTSPTEFVSVVISLFSYFQGLLCYLIVACLGAMLMSEGSVRVARYVFDDIATNAFVIIPNGLGLFSAPQLWNICYFLLCVVMTANNQFIHLAIIEKSISTTYPRMGRYKKYVIVILAAFVTILTMLLMCRGMAMFTKVFFKDAVRFLEVINAFLYSLTYCYIYGVQKICDDVHFIQGRPPTSFWVLCWYVLPICLLAPVYGLFFLVSLPSYVFWIWYITIVIVSTLPIPVMAIVELIIHTRERNIVGVLKPKERWGPIDPEERHLRRMFNPREEIRCRRRRETCQHNCLHASSVLQSFVHSEKKKREENPDGSKGLRSSSSMFL